MKLVKLLANLGYGSRKDMQRLIRYGAVTDVAGRVLGENEVPPHEEIRVRGEALDPAAPSLSSSTNRRATRAAPKTPVRRFTSCSRRASPRAIPASTLSDVLTRRRPGSFSSPTTGSSYTASFIQSPIAGKSIMPLLIGLSRVKRLSFSPQAPWC